MMKGTKPTPLDEMAPKRRRMMEMILTLGGLKEEATIPPGKINEEIAQLRDDLEPLVAEIIAFPGHYYQEFTKVVETTGLIDRINDRAALKKVIERIEGALELSDMKGLPSLLELLRKASAQSQDETDSIRDTEELVTAILKIKGDLMADSNATQELLDRLNIKVRYGDPPCHVACPAGVHAQRFVNLTRDGRFCDALALMRTTYPFSGTLGRVCSAPCEDKCTRGHIDQSVSIRNLHRFLADDERATGSTIPDPIPIDKEERVAVVGAGPAGIACAYDLIRLGYSVTIFEAQPKPGGLLRYGIPSYRLPRDILDEEISYVEHLGVEIITGQRIKSPAGLLKKGFSAVFVATGASSSRKMMIEGEDTKRVHHALEFLDRVNKDKTVSLGKRVAVVGGGNAAIDSARVTCRLGSKVTMIYRRSREEMPAHHSEIEAAEQEGVELMTLVTPVSVVASNGKVTGLRCVRMELGEPDSSGRRRPIPVPDSEFDLEVDDVIIAIGQQIDPDGYFPDMDYSAWGWIEVDPVTLQTKVSGVFAGGDCVTGPDIAVSAVAAGKKAAIAIDFYLQGNDLSGGLLLPQNIRASLDADKVQAEEIRRAAMPELEIESRTGNFDEVELGFDAKTARREANRCINCSLSNMTVNAYGEDIDSAERDQLAADYLESEVERGVLLTLIRRFGVMTAKDLSEKTGLPQDRVFQHLLRMKRSELLVTTGESHGYLLYDVPRTPTESEIALETASSLALQLAKAEADLTAILTDLKAEDIGNLASALETFSRSRDKLLRVTIYGSAVDESSLNAIEEKIRSSVVLTTRTRARLPSTRPKVTIDSLIDVDVPSVLEEYKSQMGYAPLLGFGTINWEVSRCLGCRSCEIACPEDAIKLIPVIETPRMFEFSDESLADLPVNKALFYQTVRHLAVNKPTATIRMDRDVPGFGTVETDLYLCIGCRTCVRRCPGPKDGALELELKWTLPEVIRKITAES